MQNVCPSSAVLRRWTPSTSKEFQNSTHSLASKAEPKLKQLFQITGTHTHAHTHTHTVHAHTHAHTLAAGIHVPATATQSRVELLPITRQCLEGVPAQLQSLRDPRRPGIAPGWVKDPVGGSRWASPGASCLSPDADPRPRSHGSPLPQGTQHFILPKCGQQSSPASLSPIIKRRS